MPSSVLDVFCVLVAWMRERISVTDSIARTDEHESRIKDLASKLGRVGVMEIICEMLTTKFLPSFGEVSSIKLFIIFAPWCGLVVIRVIGCHILF